MTFQAVRCFLPVVLLLFAVSEVRAEPNHDPHHGHHHGPELPAGEFVSDSIYHLESEWSSSESERLKFSQFAGTPQIVTMFYASCSAACPVLVENVKRIERALSAAGIRKVGFVLVTFDPERDSERELKRYAEKRGLNRTSWTLLRSGAEDTLELAVLLGMKYKGDGSGGFAHSNILTLLDAEGRVIHRKVGLQLSDSDVQEFVAALRQNEPFPPDGKR